MGEALQQLWCATLLDPSAAVNREVLLKALLADPVTLERYGDARIAPDVAELPLGRRQVARDDLITVQANPMHTTRGLPSASRVARCASAPESISSRAAAGITVTAES